MPIVFYGQIDRNTKGNIGSQYPAWMLEGQIEQYREGIESKKRRLARGEVPQDSIPQVMQEIERESKRLDEIVGSKPKLTDKENDEIAKVYKTLSDDIKDSMFTRTDMMKGLASPNEEYKRMKTPVIKVTDKVAELCEANGIRVESGKVSRDGATKLWKITGAYLNEKTNVENLRRDGLSARGRHAIHVN